MSEHVTDRLPELLAGRLDPPEETAVRRHLDECGECAADLRWARELLDDTLRKGLRHPAPERLTELSEGAGDPPSAAETAHLEACAECQRERDWIASLPSSAVAEVELGATGAPRGRVVPLWFGGSMIAAAAAVTVLFVLPHGRVAPDVSELARFDPLPVEQSRRAATSAFEENRMAGLECYAEGDWGEARDALRSALDERPDSEEIRLYLGSAEVLAGDREVGRRTLLPLGNASSQPEFREEALWILANVALAAGDATAAESPLRELADGTGRHAAPATDLLRDLQR